MIKHVIFISIGLLFLTQKGFCKLSNKTRIQTFLNTPENKDSLHFVAVFMLATFQPDYFDARILAAKQTWAHPVKTFYAVTGESIEERTVLHDTHRCKNHTEHYRKVTRHVVPPTKEEMYVCDGIHILHLPYCDNSYYGASVSIFEHKMLYITVPAFILAHASSNVGTVLSLRRSDAILSDNESPSLRLSQVVYVL